MKNLLSLFFLTFLASLTYAQEIPAKANTIVIRLSDSSNVQEKVITTLSSRDFEVKNPGKNPSLVTTDPKTLKNKARISLSAQIDGAEIVLKGTILIAGQGNLPIEYKGNKGTPSMVSWEEMDKVAKALGGQIRYEVK